MTGLKGLVCAVCAIWLAGCAHFPGREPPQQKPLPTPTLEALAPGVWVHKSYGMVGDAGPVLSQGLVARTADGIVLVDTAWTDEDTKSLLDLIERETGALPELAILTHAHDDKMGGMGALAEARIATRAHPLTNADAPARGLRPANIAILDTENFASLFGYREAGDEAAAEEGPVQVFYPGPGHTRDNIVVYYAPAKVLFAGCLIRPADARDLGHSADGDVANWAGAARAVAARFPGAEIVVPSHGAPGGRALLAHTAALADAAAAP